MNKQTIFLILLSVGLVISVFFHFQQYEQNQKLEEAVTLLKQPSLATAVAKDFIQTLSTGTGSNKDKAQMAKITTEKAQKRIFAPFEDYHEKGDLSHKVVFERTYVNPLKTGQVNVILQYHLDYNNPEMYNTDTYEMSIHLVQEQNQWKVDEYDTRVISCQKQ